MAEDIPGINDERLPRRLDFLLSRAAAHLESGFQDTRRRAAAATLYRDAACVALMLGNSNEARKHLVKAGRLFMDIGLTSGAALIALAEPWTARQVMVDYSGLIEGVKHQQSKTEREDHRWPMAEMARSAPRQILSLMQSEWLLQEAEKRPPSIDDTELYAALKRNSGYPVGATGVSLETYSNMAQWMVGYRSHGSIRIPPFVARSLNTIFASRAEHLRAAMNDRFHWRLLARPSELLDLDIVILCSLALGAGIDQSEIRRYSAPDMRLDAAPLSAALLLRGDTGTISD